MIKRILSKIKRSLVVHVHDVTKPYEIKIASEKPFKGQIAVVTGGSGVIGRSICFYLGASGCKVYVGGTRDSSIDPIVQEMRDMGLDAEPLVLNLLDPKSIAKAFNNVAAQNNNKLDLLVDCAGGGARGDIAPIDRQTPEVISRIIDLNLKGAILSVKEAAKIMKQNGKGNVVIVSSTVGVRGMKMYSEYAAAKAGVIAFATSVAMELGEYGIRVNCVTPGIVQRGSIDDRQIEIIKKTNWLNSYGKPEDIASMVNYLNSKEASFITGQNFIVDGGRSLGLKGAN